MTEDLFARVLKLERQNRRMRGLFIGCLLLGGITAFVAATAPRPKMLEADTLKCRDLIVSNGPDDIRVIIGSDATKTMLNVMGPHHDSPERSATSVSLVASNRLAYCKAEADKVDGMVLAIRGDDLTRKATFAVHNMIGRNWELDPAVLNEVMKP